MLNQKSNESQTSEEILSAEKELNKVIIEKDIENDNDDTIDVNEENIITTTNTDNKDLLDKVIGSGDEIPDFELEPEENPHIDEFTPSSEGEAPPVSSIQITEEDRLRVLVAQLQIQNLELENKVIEQKYGRKADELNHIITDYKTRYKVPDEWQLHGPSGTFNKKQ